MKAHRWLQLRLALLILTATLVVAWLAFVNVLAFFLLIEHLGAS